MSVIGGYSRHCGCARRGPSLTLMRHLLLIGGGPIRSRLRRHQALLQPIQIKRSQLKNKLEFNGQVSMGRHLSSIAQQKAARSVEPVKLKWIRPSKQSQRLTCGTIWRKSERFSVGFAPASR